MSDHADFMTEVWAWKLRNPDVKGMPISALIEFLAFLPPDAVLLMADLECVRLLGIRESGDRQIRGHGPTLDDHDIILRIGQKPAGS